MSVRDLKKRKSSNNEDGIEEEYYEVDREKVFGRGKPLNIQAQIIILLVADYLRRENIAENKLCGKLVEITKLNRRAIERLLVNGPTGKKEDSVRKHKSRLDDFDFQSIRNTVYEFYSQNVIPTLSAILKKVRERLSCNLSKSSLHRALLSIGFKYKIYNRRSFVMESRRIQILRLQFLDKIKEYRNEGRNIVYLDETWFDTHDVVKKGWTDGTKRCTSNLPPSRGKRLLILHAGSANGWVKNCLLLSSKCIKSASADYHQDMNAELFETWVQTQLIPNLPENSVIVMDNASYHSRQIFRMPSMAMKKEDILKFMEERSIEFPKPPPKKAILLGK